MRSSAGVWLFSVFCLVNYCELCAQSVATVSSESSRPTAILHEGTEVVLAFAQDVNCQFAKEGEPIELVVAEPVKAGSIEIVSSGTRAIGTVAKHAGSDSNSLAAVVRPKLLRFGNTGIPLRGTVDVCDAASVRRTAIKRGTLMKAYVDAEIQGDSKPFGGLAESPRNAPPTEQNQDSVARPGTIRLTEGKLVSLRLLEPISSKTAKAGDIVKFEVFEHVKVEDLIVIARNSPASGTIVIVQPAKRAWRSGKLAIRLDSVTLVNKQQQPLEFQSIVRRGTPNGGDEAINAWTDAAQWTGGLAFFFLPLAPLQHGRQANLPVGTVLEAVTHGEVLLDRASIEACQPK